MDLLRIATRVAAPLDPGLVRSVESMLEELSAATKAVDLAERHSRRLRTEPSLEWVADQLVEYEELFEGFTESARAALEYVEAAGRR